MYKRQKERLAYEITKIVHGEEEAEKAREAARALFSGGADSTNMPTTKITKENMPEGSVSVIDLLLLCGLCPSKSEARRLIQQGGVSVNDQKVTDANAMLRPEDRCV